MKSISFLRDYSKEKLVKHMSQEKLRRIKCPLCNSDMKYEDYDYDDDLCFHFECPKCKTRIDVYVDGGYMIKETLAKMGYGDVKIDWEGG